MKTKNLFEQEYVAPEMEVILTAVEHGFEASVTIDSLEEENYGEY